VIVVEIYTLTVTHPTETQSTHVLMFCTSYLNKCVTTHGELTPQHSQID